MIDDKIKKEILSVDFGVVGTSLFGGILSEEFNPKLDGQNGLNTYDEMRKSDGAVGGMLEAITAPLLSAKYFIKEYDDSEQSQVHADFVRKVLFEDLKGGYMQFVRESLTYLPFGFSLFEKIYRINEDGFIVWDRLAPRLQKSILKWSIDGHEWTDGHPAGITQQLPGNTDDIEDKANKIVAIPWSKLIHFAHRQEGNNFQGVSILRNAYKHWFYKDLLYQIQGISAERFGVGIPVAKHPASISESSKAALEEMLRNLRANEQAYIRLEDGIEIDLMTVKGDPKAGSIAESIAHHDRKIYDSILAGFLNLTSGEGGSNALSADHSSFFLRTLKGYANYHAEVMNGHIKELVDLNFADVEGYPTLAVEDLGDVEIKQKIDSIMLAKEKGLVTWLAEDELVMRELLGLTGRTLEEIAAAREQEKQDRLEIAKATAPQSTFAETVKKKSFSEKVIKPTQREREFGRQLNGLMDFLDESYNAHEEVLIKAEEKYKKVLSTIYDAVDTTRIDGIVVIDSTPKNRQLMKKAISAIDEITKVYLKDKLINSPLQDKLFNGVEKLAVQNIKANQQYLADIKVDQAKFNSFIAGHISNIDGVTFNEPRRLKEEVILNFGTKVRLELAKNQAEAVSFNKNIFKLSVVTHAQSAYSGIIYDQAIKDGFTFFKVVVPPNRLKDVKPSGFTAGILFGIYTVAQLNAMANEATEGKNTNAVSGMGMHHSSFEFYYAIASTELEEEEEIAKQQKKEFTEMSE